MMNVLFLCTGNSCRSQMAEAWARYFHSDNSYTFYSAGIEAHGMNPHAIAVMAESGIDMSDHYSKTLDELSSVAFDVVITVCSHADQNCPVLNKGERKIHVGFDDPPRLAKDAPDEYAALDCYRRVRDEIKECMSRLDQLINAPAVVS